MNDRRADIIEAGLTVLREDGYVGFTQPRVASRAGLRQSHLTYYFPTRLDLLAAVGRSAVDGQLAAADAAFCAEGPVENRPRAIAHLIVQHQNTRVLLALAQAADDEPRLQGLFRELADGFIFRITSQGDIGGLPAPTEQAARMLQALVVGLAVVDLATGRPNGLQRATDILTQALRVLAGSP